MSKYSRPERERRFLVVSDDPWREVPPVRITDFYLRGLRLRLRRIDEPSGPVFKLTQKKSRGPSWDDVTTIYLSEAEFESLTRLPHDRLEKDRHRLSFEGVRWAIDRLDGPLAGLVLAETEDFGVDGLEDAPFLGVEVTTDSRFGGYRLATEGLPGLN